MTTLLIIALAFAAYYRFSRGHYRRAYIRELNAHAATKEDAERCRHMWRLADEVGTHYAKKCGAIEDEDQWPEVIG